MPARAVRQRKVATEFFPLPPNVRPVHERAIRQWSADPFASGLGYETFQLSPTSGVVAPIWSMKVGGFRVFYIGDGDTVKIGGLGARPGFYRKLSRVRGLVRNS